jgi:hypothetical protein
LVRVRVRVRVTVKVTVTVTVKVRVRVRVTVKVRVMVRVRVRLTKRVSVGTISWGWDFYDDLVIRLQIGKNVSSFSDHFPDIFNNPHVNFDLCFHLVRPLTDLNKIDAVRLAKIVHKRSVSESFQAL